MLLPSDSKYPLLLFFFVLRLQLCTEDICNEKNTGKVTQACNVQSQLLFQLELFQLELFQLKSFQFYLFKFCFGFLG
jgi:hypothetical protein